MCCCFSVLECVSGHNGVIVPPRVAQGPIGGSGPFRLFASNERRQRKGLRRRLTAKQKNHTDRDARRGRLVPSAATVELSAGPQPLIARHRPPKIRDCLAGADEHWVVKSAVGGNTGQVIE